MPEFGVLLSCVDTYILSGFAGLWQQGRREGLERSQLLTPHVSPGLSQWHSHSLPIVWNQFHGPNLAAGKSGKCVLRKSLINRDSVDSYPVSPRYHNGPAEYKLLKWKMPHVNKKILCKRTMCHTLYMRCFVSHSNGGRGGRSFSPGNVQTKGVGTLGLNPGLPEAQPVPVSTQPSHLQMLVREPKDPRLIL